MACRRGNMSLPTECLNIYKKWKRFPALETHIMSKIRIWPPKENH